MLHSRTDLKPLHLRARDGDIRHVEDAYFDDRDWLLRYIVVDTGGWLSGRKVLIAPAAIRRVEWDREEIVVDLTREQVENSPHIDADKPISRQQEATYFDYYGYSYYWSDAFVSAGVNTIPPEVIEQARIQQEEELAHADPNLRSLAEVTGYRIEAADGDIGHIDDFLFDDETWMLRYLVVDTRDWLPGRRVVVAPDWVERVSWTERKVFVDLSKGAVNDSPEYRDPTSLTAEQEAAIYRHFGRASSAEPFAPNA